MGYDSKLYIVDKTTLMDNIQNEPNRYAQVIASYDMRKFGGFNGIFKTPTDCYFYADDGNTKVLKDCYGDPLKEASIKEVINYLEKYAETHEPYRRVEPLLAMLKAFDVSKWSDLTVLHYGH